MWSINTVSITGIDCKSLVTVEVLRKGIIFLRGKKGKTKQKTNTTVFVFDDVPSRSYYCSSSSININIVLNFKRKILKAQILFVATYQFR